ncbi:hypothetical protein BJX61DRAFT_537821 [Aspergillus egyptiacus]|nr:hypothetical protein BJX61DRAFT_537821 [Aspergillus egyptiacus]
MIPHSNLQLPLALSPSELPGWAIYYALLAWLGYHSLWKVALSQQNTRAAIKAKSTPMMWNIFNQFYGAAFVYPLYLLLQAATTGFANLPPVRDPQTRSALLASAIMGSLLPFAFIFPAFVQCSVARRQRAIALYRFAPVVFSLLQLLAEQIPLATAIFPAVPESGPYLAAGVAAAVAHWYALIGALLVDRKPRRAMARRWKTRLGELYLPLSLTGGTTPPSSVLSQAAHEFLQYDMLILVAAFLLDHPLVGILPRSPFIMRPTEATAGWERLRRSCDACQDSKVKCSQHKPSCHRCLRHRQPCVYSPQRRTGRPPKRPNPPSRRDPVPNNNSNDAGATPAIIIHNTTNNNNNDNDHLAHDLVLPDIRADDAQRLTGDAAMTADGIDPMEEVFQSTFEAFLAASMPAKDGFVQDLQDHTIPTAFPLDNSPSTSDLFGNFPLLLPDYNTLPIAPPPTHVLELEQLPPLSAASSSTNTGSSERGDCGAKCYTSVLQQLLFLRQSLPESTRPSIDVIMQAERHVRGLLDRILGCNACVSNRSSVLLMSAITERVIQMLDWIIEEKTLLDTENARSTRRTFRSWARLPPASGARRRVCRVPLTVGNTTLDEDFKQNFLKQFILLRLKKLAVKVQEARRTTTTRPGDCIYSAAELVLTDSLQRLDYLRGQVQLWD